MAFLPLRVAMVLIGLWNFVEIAINLLGNWFFSPSAWFRAALQCNRSWNIPASFCWQSTKTRYCQHSHFQTISFDPFFVSLKRHSYRRTCWKLTHQSGLRRLFRGGRQSREMPPKIYYRWNSRLLNIHRLHSIRTKQMKFFANSIDVAVYARATPGILMIIDWCSSSSSAFVKCQSKKTA